MNRLWLKYTEIPPRLALNSIKYLDLFSTVYILKQ